MSILKSETLGDLRVLYEMAFFSRKGESHAERLDAYYGKQAAHYDRFRKRLLHGREEMFRALEVPEGGRWADIGGGTGANVEVLGPSLQRLESYAIVDLSKALLGVAEQRRDRLGWTNVDLIQGDACTELFPKESLDVVTFSYALTMIPEWHRAIDQALRALKPGGRIGVVDFFVGRKGDREFDHSPFQRHFWPLWFGIDHVYLSADHLPYLRARFDESSLKHNAGALPFLPMTRVPYYSFIGRKPTDTQ